MNLQDAFDVFAWVIENAVRRYSDTEHVNTFLRPLHEASRLSAELAFRIAARIRSINDSGISATRHTELSITNVIHTGNGKKRNSLRILHLVIWLHRSQTHTLDLMNLR